MANVFISYTRRDAIVAQEIYDRLVSEGYTVWMDKKSLSPGQDWRTEIEKAIRACDVFIACLSNYSVNKTGFVQAELKKALEIAELMPEGRVFIIPVRLDNCQVPHSLEKLHWLDYFEADSQGNLLGAIQNRVDSEKSLEKELKEFLLHNGPETLKERSHGISRSKITKALLVIAKREDELQSVRSRAVRGLSLLKALDQAAWSEIIPLASTELLEEWIALWGEDSDTTVLEADLIRAMLESRRLPKISTVFGKAVRKFIARGAEYTSSVFLSGSKYPFWEVKYDCVRSVMTLDDADSMRVLASFSTMSYWKARRRIIDYIKNKYEDGELALEEKNIAAAILNQITTDGKSDDSTPTLRMARELLEIITTNQAAPHKVKTQKNILGEREPLYDAGERIKVIRTELGLKPSQFFELVGLASQREYESIENGEKEAPLSLLKTINQVSGANLEWLKHEEGSRYKIEAVHFRPVDADLEYCSGLNPQEYFLTLDKKSLHVGLIAQTSEYRYQVIDTGVMLNFWAWTESYWAIPAFYDFLDRLSGPWHDIDGVVLPPQYDQKLFKGDIHFLTAYAYADRFGGDLLYDLLDLDNTRNEVLSYAKKYGGNWMPKVHDGFRKYLKLNAKTSNTKSETSAENLTQSRKTIVFQEPTQLPTYDRAIIWKYPFTVVNTALLGEPEEISRTALHDIVVKATIELISTWNLFHPLTSTTDQDEIKQMESDRQALMKVLFWFGKQHIQEKLKIGKLVKQEELVLGTSSLDVQNRLDVSRIPDPKEFTFEV